MLIPLPARYTHKPMYFSLQEILKEENFSSVEGSNKTVLDSLDWPHVASVLKHYNTHTHTHTPCDTKNKFRYLAMYQKKACSIIIEYVVGFLMSN